MLSCVVVHALFRDSLRSSFFVCTCDIVEVTCLGIAKQRSRQGVTRHNYGLRQVDRDRGRQRQGDRERER